MADLIAKHETHMAGTKFLISFHDIPDPCLIEGGPSGWEIVSGDGGQDPIFIL